MIRSIILGIGLSTTVVVAAAAVDAPPWEGPLAITHTRPAWLQEGVAIAGNWSSITQRRQRINAPWTEMGYGLSDEQAQEAYRKELTPEMADRIKALGVTLVILPLWSGMGSEQDERPGMKDTRRFAELLHARGMRVGVYIHQGMLSRGFLEADRRRYEWLAWPSTGSIYTTPPAPETEVEGYPVYRNHPEYQAFMRGIVEYAIRDVRADFLHFDNYVYGSGVGPHAIEDFRAYLRTKYPPERLGALLGKDDSKDLGTLVSTGAVPISHEWQCFQAWVLGESYRKLAEYARSLNPQVATDVNASGMSVGFRRPIDLSQLVPHGDAFWDEQAQLGWDPEHGLLHTGIRTYKLARLYHQSALTYTPDRLANCESLAFNYDSQGCMYWFLYGRLNWAVAVSAAAGEDRLPETRFYREHRDLYGIGETLADVGVLRGRAVNLYGLDEAVQNAYLFEQAMITRHVPFEILFDQHLHDLSKYRCVALPDVRMLDDEQIERLLRYVEAGGGLVITDETGTQDCWGRRRSGDSDPFLRTAKRGDGALMETRGKGRVVYRRIGRPESFAPGCLPTNASELAAATVEAMRGEPSIRTDAPAHVGMEFVRQPGRLLIHVLDYSRHPSFGPVRIWPSAAMGTVKTARMLAPRHAASELSLENEGDGPRVTVPELDFYSVVVLDIEDTTAR